MVKILEFVFVLAIGIFSSGSKKKGIGSGGKILVLRFFYWDKQCIVLFATKCPTLCSRSRSRDVCFMREFAAFIREVRLLTLSPGDMPAA